MSCQGTEGCKNEAVVEMITDPRPRRANQNGVDPMPNGMAPRKNLCAECCHLNMELMRVRGFGFIDDATNVLEEAVMEAARAGR